MLSSGKAFDTRAGHVVLAMITLAHHAPWPLDCAIDDLASPGLPAPSVLRCKLFTLDARLIRSALGKLAAADSKRVSRALDRLWGNK